jgi:branched-chain amino acid transport system substrate-binding protein
MSVTAQTAQALPLARLARLAPAVLISAGCSRSDAQSEAAGVTATEIKIGQTMPYSGPASAYGTIGKVEQAYFKVLNEKGGVNGHKISLISLDDGYVPPKALEQTRRLVEQDSVAFIFNSVGTPSNTAIQPYLEGKKIPQLFVATGADKWGDPKSHPWTMGWAPSYRTEAKIYARYLMKEKPDAKLCVLYQNDDFGKDYLAGLHEALGAGFDKTVVKTASYEVTDPTVDSQIVMLQGAGCDTLLSATTPKFGAGAIRKVHDIGWKPTFIMANVSVSVTTVLKPAGLDKSTGIITARYLKDASDPAFKDDAALNDYRAFMKQYLPDVDPVDANAVYGYAVAGTLVKVLNQCGKDLSRQNVMKQAASLKDFEVPLAISGIKINTGATDFRPFSQMQLGKFNGTSFEQFGPVLSE